MPGQSPTGVGVGSMRRARWLAAILLLAAGGLVFLLPGVLKQPDLATDVVSTEDGEFQDLISTLLDPSTAADDGPEADAGSLSSDGSALSKDATSADGLAADYATVFPVSSVQRLDITMDPTDWEGLLTQVSSSSIGNAGLRPDAAAGWREGMNARNAFQQPEAFEQPAESDLPGEFAPSEGAQAAGELQPPAFGDVPEQGVVPPSDEGVAAPNVAQLARFADVCADCEAGDEVSATLGNRTIAGVCVEVNGALVFQPSGDEMPGVAAPANGAPTVEGDGAAVSFRNQLPDGAFDRAGAGMLIDETADADLTYVPCTVSFDGETWEHVGIRFKGNSTLMTTASSGSWKYPLHLDFDEYEETYPETEDQRFYGFDDLSLSNGATDDSLLRDYVPAHLFAAFGVPTPRAAFYQVTLDLGEGPTLLGLYTVIETPDDPLLQAAFGDTDGNLYKPQGSGATWASFDAESFEKKSNVSEADWTDIEEAIATLHAPRDDAAEWRAAFEDVFDVDGFLRWLAVNRLLGNWDAYGQMAQNYYLYHSSSDDLFHWIPWDNNMSLNAGMQRGATDIDPRSVGDQWPLISTLMEDPVYVHAYTTYVAEALASIFDADTLQTLISEAAESIAPFVVDEDGALSEYSFVDSTEGLDAATDQLLTAALRNIEQAETYLASESYETISIVISEIHYNASPDQGDDDRYEFIELYNRGDAPVDLSDYRFDKGIEITLPRGTRLEPGCCLLVASDAETYNDLDVEVLEWKSGSLSNGGETVRLVDADGYWIDTVTYADERSWPTAADGGGPSLEVVDVSAPNHVFSNWRSSVSTGGTPGTVNGS